MKGFTLVEILIVITITGVIGFLLTQLLIQNNSVYFAEDAKVSQGLSLNTISNKLQTDIKQASGIASGYPVSLPTYLSSLDTLVLQLPAIDSSGNPIDNVFDYVVYAKDPVRGYILKRMVYKDDISTRIEANQVLTTSLSLINFYYYDQNNEVVSPTFASKINFVINVSSKTGLSQQQSSSSGQVNLRNN